MTPKLLITNDDGMNAALLIPLIRYCRTLGEVEVVVPKYEQSGKSQSIEIHKSFEAQKVCLAEDITVWAVDSSPADCVRFALLGLGMKPDLVISGINRGLNIGGDTLYSGTVGAASEAVNLGSRGLALSTTTKNYDSGAVLEQLDRVFAYLKAGQLFSRHSLYNVNIPPEPKSIRITRQGGLYYSDSFPKEAENLYHPTGVLVWQDTGDDTLDTDATVHGYITITPLTIDKTASQVYEALKERESITAGRDGIQTG